MSWDGYIDSIIGSSKGSCDTAAIIGLNGGKWTTDGHAAHVKFSAEEAVAIASAMSSDDFAGFQAKGIFLNGEKFQFLRADTEEGIVFGKKKDRGSLTFHKSNTAIILAHTAEGKAQGDTNASVGKIIEYLKGNNM